MSEFLAWQSLLFMLLLPSAAAAAAVCPHADRLQNVIANEQPDELVRDPVLHGAVLSARRAGGTSGGSLLSLSYQIRPRRTMDTG